MNCVPASHFEAIAILSSISDTSSLMARAAILNCTSICGASVHPNESGAAGFSTDKSLTYCEMMAAAGLVSAPLASGASVSSRVMIVPSSDMVGLAFCWIEAQKLWAKRWTKLWPRA